jgi:thiol:disulfide interchange protein
VALSKQHEVHKRRFSRNLGLGLVLVAFVGLVFLLTVAKVSDDGLGAQSQQQTQEAN